MERFYPIGTPGEPWTDRDRARWLATQTVQRSYADEVLRRLEAPPEGFVVERYGALSIDPERYPLLAVKTATIDDTLPWALVTGGVHGYETSGVQGALAFLDEAGAWAGRLNLLIAPCVSPWGYEVIHRWNPSAVDPNRSFVADSPSEEAAALMALVRRTRSARPGTKLPPEIPVADTSGDWLVHLDLHETTDSDEAEFRPALAARDGKDFERGTIPDGFYLVGDAARPQPEFLSAIIDAVEAVTHIAPPDEDGEIIGCEVAPRGVIHYPFAELGLCAGVTNARFTATTEVYPDSQAATAAICNAAQVAAVRAALDFALASARD